MAIAIGQVVRVGACRTPNITELNFAELDISTLGISTLSVSKLRIIRSG
jgi:hypothetical protein